MTKPNRTPKAKPRAPVYLTVNACNVHKYYSIAVETEDGSGIRLTDGKCCGSWATFKWFKIDPERVCEEIKRVAKG